MVVQINNEKSESSGDATATDAAAAISAREYLDHLLSNGDEETETATNGEIEFPPWYNEELFKRAQYFYKRYLFALFGGMSAGLIAVLGIPSILDVLIGTKQSGSSATAYRRYISTILHVQSWYECPLKPGSDSWKSIQIVRRAHFKSSKICEKAKSGRITQKDLALTQFGFTGFITLQGRISENDFYEANIHFWRVIGYMLGIKDEYNLCTDSWATTKPRLELVLTEIYRPALENTSIQFYEMTKYLISGLWCLNALISLDSSIFITKWLAGCKGYEYSKSDFRNEENIPNDGLSIEYKKLNFYDRFVINYFMIVTFYLYPYNIVRIYMNFRTKLSVILIYYFPILAFFRFGIRWAYVRIPFKKSKSADAKGHED